MELKELIERVKAATGPDRVLGVEVLLGVGGWIRNGPELFDHKGTKQVHLVSPPDAMPTPWDHLIPTISIDAALALVERCLPDWTYNVGNTGPDDACWACLTRPDGDCTDFGSSAETIPLAIILTLLTALDQKEEDK